MLYWNPQRHYRFFSSDEREFLVDEMSPLNFPKWMKRLNVLLNIAAPLFLYFVLKLPWKEMAIAFIAFDVLLHVFEQVVFITLPWAVSKIPLVPFVQWQYNGVSRYLSRVEDRLDTYRKINCADCHRCISSTRCTSCTPPKQLTQKRDRLTATQEQLKVRLDKLIAKQNGAPQTKPTPTPVVQKAPEVPQSTTLASYFQNLSTECSKIISTHRFDFLISVRKNADALASILKNKPEGETEIAGTLCYRLDNLVKLLNTLSAESDEVRSVYFEDAKAVSNALAEEMQQAISAINKLIPGVDTNTPEILLTKTKMTKEINNV